MKLAVVGATGAVGLECLHLLDRGVLPVDQVVPVASARSAGRDLAGELGLSVPARPVVDLADFDPDGVDVAVFSAGAEISQHWIPAVADAGALVVDNSSAFRMEPDVPLVVPQINAHALAERPARGIVANPNCSTIQLVRALHPLLALGDLDLVVVATYQSASGGGLTGLREFRDSTGKALRDGPEHDPGPGRFGPDLAFNVIPEIGARDEWGIAHEERKLAREPRKILDLPGLRLTATAVRVPVLACHSEAVHLRFRSPVTAADACAALAAAPDVRLYKDDYPMPRQVARSAEDRGKVHVGRVRADPDDSTALWLWVVADNVVVGAALNALQIVQEATRRPWLR